MNIVHYLLLYTLLPLLIVVVSLYVWGGICYAFFRFSQPETDARLHKFLNDSRRFLSSGSGSVTRANVGRAGLLGWGFAPLAYIGINASHLGVRSLFLDTGILFFGGLMFARAWYAKRCMRLLDLETLDAQPA